MKTCPKCNKEYGDESTFCTDCGGKLNDRQPIAPSASGINLGDKNVISGEIIGHKEDIRVSGNATIVKNEDQTREVKACGFCGKPKLILEGVFCRRCGAFVCEEHFDKDTHQCLKCQRGMSSEAEQKYMTVLQEVMIDNRIDSQERQRLDEERKRLNLTEDRTRELENNYKSLLSAQIDTLGRRERRRLDIARQALMESFNVDDALTVLTPLFERFRDNPDVRGLYLLALLEKNPEKALLLIQEMRFDDLDKSLAHIEALVRQGNLDQAADVIRQVRRAFGEEHPVLLARDAELSIEEYRITKRAAMLDDARECIEQIPKEIADPYVIVVKAYLEYTSGAKDALDQIADVLREKNYPPFYLHRLRKRLGLTAVATNSDEESRTPVIAEPPEHTKGKADAGLDLLRRAAEKGGVPAALTSLWLAYASALEKGDNYVGLGINWVGDYGKVMKSIGIDVNSDAQQSKAIEYLRDLAFRDPIAGLGTLAMLSTIGAGGVALDPVESEQLWEQVAEKGVSVAPVLRQYARQRKGEGLNWVGVNHRDGINGANKDDGEAVKCFRQSAELGNANAQVNLGWMYANGRGVATDYGEAVKWYRAAADKGNAFGQNNLGWAYENGCGVSEDIVEALKWYKLAADKGHVLAKSTLGDASRQYTFATYYERQSGRWNKDPVKRVKYLAEAAKWYKLATDQNHDNARTSLQDVTQELQLFKAAKDGNIDAMRRLGSRSVMADDWCYWYKMAADRGDVEAKLKLVEALNNWGFEYRDGTNGYDQDDAEAVKYFREAAELGNAVGQVNLGWMYLNGKGVERNDTEAAKWYRMAAEQGDVDAKKKLVEIEKVLEQNEKIDQAVDDVVYPCPQCGHSMRVSRIHAGKKGRCKECGFVSSIPLTSFCNSPLGGAWYLKINNGSIYGPVEADELRQWAEQCRVAPGNEVSRDKTEWIPAENLPDLEMNWKVCLSNGSSIGPFNIKAVMELIRIGEIKPDSKVINKLTGENYIKQEPIASQSTTSTQQDVKVIKLKRI